MPRVTVDNKEIVVSFQHGTKPSNYQGHRRPKKVRLSEIASLPEAEYTKCVVLVGENGCRDENKTKAGEAEVTRYYKDTPNRINARRFSLQKALANSPLTHDEREAAWSLLVRK